MNTDREYAARISGLDHYYGGTHALNNIDLDIPAGQITGFIGPDGVGKSTLLSLLAGARTIQNGDVEVLGGDMRSGRFRRTVQPRIAYMPQGLGRNLYPSLSVFENIDFFGRLFGQPTEVRHERIRILLQSTGLAEFQHRAVAQLSGGMKQKLGLCCALIHDPELLILDEPTTGVDPLSRHNFWQLLRQLHSSQRGMTVLISTAYMEEATAFDKLVALHAGHIIGTGSAEELCKHTGVSRLEDAFVVLLPEAARRAHTPLSIPPRRQVGRGVAIEAHGLTRRFGDFTAVDNVELRIERGEIFGFLGSNGCGKTTTMKMLTGLLEPTAGEVVLFGTGVNDSKQDIRRQVGYMSQSFSLYNELTVQQNLELHARIFHLSAEEVEPRINELTEEFDLGAHVDAMPGDLPLGIRQRLSLAVAIVHKPDILILDEPTSGVDPLARDEFWHSLINLSRQKNVTIFISTHFVNEAERCDRLSLMHAGRILVTGEPDEIRQQVGAETLEQAFIKHLGKTISETTAELDASDVLRRQDAGTRADLAKSFSMRRLFAYTLRETMELLRDPIRLSFALLGSMLLMFVLGYGISMDVEGLNFAVLDYDRTPQSRDYIHNLAGSRYFIERAPINNPAELERRMKGGEISLAVEIPPAFGRNIKRGRQPEVGAWVDGAMPFRGETIRGYVEAMHYDYLIDLTHRNTGVEPRIMPANLEMRYRYNQDYKSLYAMVPAVIPLLLVFIPAVIAALGVVREKELGSIINFYVTPVTRLEFLLGKQLPYIGVSMLGFLGMVALAVIFFNVPLKGSFTALTLGALLYVTATTGMGLLLSAFTRTQIAALVGTAIATMLPAIQFSGLTDPVASLEGIGAFIGKIYPMTHFLIISRGVFTKALGFEHLAGEFLPLLIAIPVLTTISVLLLRKQER